MQAESGQQPARVLGARRHQVRRHTLAHMTQAYTALLARAAAREVPSPALPAHLAPTGTEHARGLLAGFGLHDPLLD